MSNLASSQNHRHTLPPAASERLASVMFLVSMLSLLLLAGLLHLHNDLQQLSVVLVCGSGYLICCMACGVEVLNTARHNGGTKMSAWIYCLLPPLRMGARDRATSTQVWLPVLGWQQTGRALEERLDRISSVPMILIALMVLPLIGIEYVWAEQLATDPLMSALTNGAAGLIWFAFAWEFIVRLSIAANKWDYCRRHWIDLAIVLLPLISFLRAVQLGRLLRLQQLTRTARLYRLRGVTLRAWRALLLIDAVHRLISGPPHRRLAKLQALVELKQHELDELRCEIVRLQASMCETTNSLNASSADSIAHDGTIDRRVA